jgi:hypothetical protein
MNTELRSGSFHAASALSRHPAVETGCLLPANRCCCSIHHLPGLLGLFDATVVPGLLIVVKWRGGEGLILVTG